MRKIEWKQIQPRLGSPYERAYLGRIAVGSITRTMIAKGEKQTYDWRCQLPGLKSELSMGKCDSPEECRTKLGIVIGIWFNEVI